MSQELRRGRSVPRKGDSGSSRGAESSPLGSPLFRRRQFTFEASDPCLPSSSPGGPFGPGSSRAASRDSSPSGFHAIVERVCSSPKLGLRRLAVGRSGSFNDVSGDPSGGRKSLEAKSRRRWMRGAGIGRSESMRSAMPPKRAMDGSLPVISKSKSRDAGGTVWTSDEDEDAESSLGGSSSGLPSSVSAAAAFDPRRGSLPPFALSPSPVRDRSLDRVARLERRGRLAYSHSLDGGGSGGGGEEPGKMKGFVKATISVNR